WHSQNGDYAYEVWAYNVDDLIAVKNGQKQPWQIKPYATWNFDFPITEGSKHIGGVAYDPASGRIYVSQQGGDRAGGAWMPLIQVYQLNFNPPGPAAALKAPRIVSVTANPNPVTSGASVTLTATDVFEPNAGGSIVQVTFYLDTNRDGVLTPNTPNTDRVLGNGTAAGSAWQFTFSTAGLSAGNYTVFARAKDSNGVFSDLVAIILTVT